MGNMCMQILTTQVFVPILAYSVNVFCERNRQGPGSHQLYFGTDTKGRFNHNLGKLVQSFTQSEALILGCNVADIGTHSCRKGLRNLLYWIS